MQDPLHQLRRLLGPQLEELTGAHLAGHVPVSDAVINRVAAERLASMSGPVAGVQVHACAGDVLDVTLSLRGIPLISTVPVRLRIDQQPDVAESPVLGLQWSVAGLGPLARLASPFIERLATLPAGLRIEGDRVLVDLQGLLRAQGMGDLLRFVARLEVHTQDGRLVVSFEARV